MVVCCHALRSCPGVLAEADPAHERCGELSEWVPIGFDVEQFDAAQVDGAVRRIGV